MLIARPAGAVIELRMATGFLGHGLYWVSAFQAAEVLIDAGPPRAAGQLRSWLAEHPIRAALLTHYHEDHVGGAHLLGLTPLAAPAGLAALASPPRTQLFRRIVWGRARPVRAAPVSPEVEAGGMRCRAVPTPGHSPDHVAYHFPDQGWLFSGDLFVHERARYAQRDENVPLSLLSLRRLLELEFDVMYCAHAGRVAEPKAALRRKIEFLESIRFRGGELRRAGMAPERIAVRLFGRLGAWHRLTGGWFSEVNLVRSLLEDDGG